MKVFLLAAGQSKRVKPIVDKSFVTICGKSLIQWQVQAIRDAGFVDLVIVGNADNVEKLRQLRVEGARLTVVEQKDLEPGMYGALLAAKEEVLSEDAILVVSSNDVVENALWKRLAVSVERLENDGFLTGYKVSRYFPGGYLKLADDGHITGIIEKPGEGNEPSDLVNLVIHCHRDVKGLYEAIQIEKQNTKYEIRNTKNEISDDMYEQALQHLFDHEKKYTVLPYEGFWQAVKYPWHFLRLMEFYLSGLTPSIAPDAEIAKTAVVRGNVVIESGVKVFDHAVIQGPAYIGKGTVIGNHTLVRGSSLGERCVVGHATEVARSLLQNDVWMHKNYIGDSVIGSNVAFGSGTVTGNLRLDEGEISVNVDSLCHSERPRAKRGGVEESLGGVLGVGQSSQINTRLTKLGIITGDNIRVGINTSFMPGVKIGSNTMIGAGLTIKSDILPEAYVKAADDVRANVKKIEKRSGI